MSQHKHVINISSGNGPTSMIVAMLDCVSEICGEPDQLLRDAGVGHSFTALKEGRVHDLALESFIAANRACNARLREFLLNSQGPQMTEDQFLLLCRCLIGCADLREVIVTTSSFFDMFGGALGAFRPAFDPSGRRVARYSLSPPVAVTPMRCGVSAASTCQPENPARGSSLANAACGSSPSASVAIA